MAGYKRWQQLGRQVRKGETSLAILAPIVRKVDEDGEEVGKVVGFRSARVFDVSQTEGEPPEVPLSAARGGLYRDSRSVGASTKRSLIGAAFLSRSASYE